MGAAIERAAVPRISGGDGSKKKRRRRQCVALVTARTVWQDEAVLGGSLAMAMAGGSGLDLSIDRSTLDAIDLWTRIGAGLLAIAVLALVYAFVRAEADVPVGRRVAAFLVGSSGALAWVGLVLWWGGGWVVAPGGYGIDTGDYLVRVIALAGVGLGAALMGFLGFALLAVDDL